MAGTRGYPESTLVDEWGSGDYMRRTPSAVAIVIAAVFAALFAAPAVSATAESDQAGAVALTGIAAVSPYTHGLSAEFASPNYPDVSPETRRLGFTLPAETVDFGSSSVDVWIWAPGGELPVQGVPFDAKTRAVGIDLPAGLLVSPGGPSGAGTSAADLQIRISARSALVSPGAPRPPSHFHPVHVGTEAEVWVTLMVGESGHEGAEAYRLDLPSEEATRFAYRSAYWPDDDLAGRVVKADDRLTVTGLPAALTQITASLLLPRDGSTTVAAPSVNGPTGVQITLPGAGELVGFLRSDGHALLDVQGTVGKQEVTATIPIVVAQETPADSGRTTRISGTDRYSGAVAYSQALLPRPGDSSPLPLYFASGESFPDALSSAPVAAHLGGALLLSSRTGPLPDGVAEEAFRLSPLHTFGVGGRSTLDDSALGAIAIATDGVSRLYGADRYETSRKLAESGFPDGADIVFVATGESFPDALSSAPAATSVGAPVVLVRGTDDRLDDATLALFDRLKTQQFVIIGGERSVSSGIQRQLDTRHPGSVERIAGADRYAVSAAVNETYFGSAEEVYLATGADYPDALSGGVLAARKGVPLLLVQSDCIPSLAAAALARWQPKLTTLLGGPRSLSASVLDLKVCR